MKGRAAPALHAAGAILAAVALACSAADPFSERIERVRPNVGAVVTEHPLATQAGLIVLQQGGNAADAAVAAALALAVVYPQAGNLGGGGFAIHVDADGRAETIDFREMAPSGYVAELYLDEDGALDRTRSLTTPLAVGVPGSPLGLYQLYSQHGSGQLNIAQLCESAISLAEGGFSVDPWLAAILARPETRLLLSADPGAARLFYPGGRPLTTEDRLVQPALARTLRRFAKEGARGFYLGEVADAIVRDLAEADDRSGRVAGPALLSRADLAAYRTRRPMPLVGTFRGHQIVAMPPPSSGGVALLQVFGMLEGLPLDTARVEALRRIELGLDAPPVMVPRGNVGFDAGPPVPRGLDARAVHWWIEAMRSAFADRAAHLGDPDQMTVPVATLLDPAWIAERRVSIGERANVEVGAWQGAPSDGSTETTHISVVDAKGNAVSLTTTLNGSFGSGIYVDEAGFLLNNELDDFSIQAGTPNAYGLVGAAANQLTPLRRPLSSMCPIVIKDERGQVALVLGSPGGPRIITAVLQVALRILAYDQGLVEAIRAPRLHQQWKPPETIFEEGWDSGLVERLESLHGQPVLPPDGRYFGSVQGILVHPSGEVEAYSDPRRGGSAGLQGGKPANPARPDQ